MENEALVLDFLEWLQTRPRTYQETMSAWRTSCPRLTIWEDAVDARLVAVRSVGESRQRVCLTAAGIDYLDCRRLGSTQRGMTP